MKLFLALVAATLAAMPAVHAQQANCVAVAGGNTLANTVSITLSVDGTRRIITANGIAEHEWGADGPPGQTVCEQTVRVDLPATPLYSTTTTAIPLRGPIAYAVNGVAIYGPQEAEGTNAVAGGGPIQVDCRGHVSPFGHYHYHHPHLMCHADVTNAAVDASKTLLGYALDGFPIFGPLTGPKLSVDAVLDECNGRWTAEGHYQYHVRSPEQVDHTLPYDKTATVNNWNYVLGCYHGVEIVSAGGAGGPPGGGGFGGAGVGDRFGFANGAPQGGGTGFPGNQFGGQVQGGGVPPQPPGGVAGGFGGGVGGGFGGGGSPPTSLPTCTDTPPTWAEFTCAQMSSFGACESGLLNANCDASCGRCAAAGGVINQQQQLCDDVPPVWAEFTCAQMAMFGACNAGLLDANCNASCGRCVAGGGGGGGGGQFGGPPPTGAGGGQFGGAGGGQFGGPPSQGAGGGQFGGPPPAGAGGGQFGGAGGGQFGGAGGGQFGGPPPTGAGGGQFGGAGGGQFGGPPPAGAGGGQFGGAGGGQFGGAGGGQFGGAGGGQFGGPPPTGAGGGQFGGAGGGQFGGPPSQGAGGGQFGGPPPAGAGGGQFGGAGGGQFGGAGGGQFGGAGGGQFGGPPPTGAGGGFGFGGFGGFGGRRR